MAGSVGCHFLIHSFLSFFFSFFFFFFVWGEAQVLGPNRLLDKFENALILTLYIFILLHTKRFRCPIIMQNLALLFFFFFFFFRAARLLSYPINALCS